MQRSDSLTSLAKALLEAQKQMENAIKGSTNPFFRSKYADFNSVKDACKDTLNKNGVLVVQMLDSEGVDQYVITQLVHAETGEFISSKLRLDVLPSDSIQEKMSKITYTKRYMLQTMAFLGSDDDDDAENGMKRTNAMANTQKVQSFSKKEKINDLTGNLEDWVFSFGKFKGKKVKEIPINELKSWYDFVSQKNPDSSACKVVKEYLENNNPISAKSLHDEIPF
jgi:hypothetical protein